MEMLLPLFILLGITIFSAGLFISFVIIFTQKNYGPDTMDTKEIVSRILKAVLPMQLMVIGLGMVVIPATFKILYLN